MDNQNGSVNNPDTEKLINDVGVVAELSALFYTTLVENGRLDVGAAGFLTEMFMRIMLRKD